MQTANCTYLPETIVRNYKTYTRFRELDRERPIKEHIEELEKKGHLVILLKVLSSKLKGKLDGHGKPYQPTEWLFVHRKKKGKTMRKYATGDQVQSIDEQHPQPYLLKHGKRVTQRMQLDGVIIDPIANTVMEWRGDAYIIKGYQVFELTETD